MPFHLTYHHVCTTPIVHAHAYGPLLLCRVASCYSYGKNTELLIDRERELQNHMLLHSLGLAPAILGRFRNGYAYDFCPGQSCSPAQVADPEIFPVIART